MHRCNINWKIKILILIGYSSKSATGPMFNMFRASAFARSYCLLLGNNSLMLSLVWTEAPLLNNPKTHVFIFYYEALGLKTCVLGCWEVVSLDKYLFVFLGEKNVTLEDVMVLEGFATVGDPVFTPFQS